MKNYYSAEDFQMKFKGQGNKIVAKKEDDVHLEVCKWIQSNYPDCIFTSDIAGRYLLNADRSVYKLRSQSKGKAAKFPDLTIFNPIGNYKGLVIELKKEDVAILNKDGTLKKNEHLQGQFEMLQKFHSFGWRATFGIGFAHCKKIISDYFDGIESEGFW